MTLRALTLLLVASLPEAHSQPTSPIRRLVHFVATDSRGQPVTDLRTGEIRVSDAGKSASVSFSRLVPVTLPTVAPREPGEYSNRSVTHPLSSILILVDLFNTDFTFESDSFQDLIRAMEKPESSNIGLVFLAPDASLLPVRELPAPGASVGALTAEQLRQALKTAEKLDHLNLGDVDFNAQHTREALENLASRLGALPGQKRLIWMTRGAPLAIGGPKLPEPMIFQTIIQQIAEEFRQLAIPVYGGSLAALTGGRNFENAGVEKAIAQAQRDVGATYLAAFYAPSVSDGKVHQLRVSTTRKGVRILSATGYTADEADAAELRPLQQAESQIADAPDLALRAAVSVQGGAAHFRIYVDGPRILLAFVFLDANGGKTVTEPVRTAVNGGSPVTVDLPVPTGTTSVRIAVENTLTTAVGTLSVPLT